MTEADDVTPVRESIDAGALPLQRCRTCAAWIWYPRVACPACFSGDLEWRQASGTGSIQSFAVLQRTHHSDYDPHLPIVLALVALDEGCQMVSTIIGRDREQVSIGDRVRVASAGRWSSLPQFELAVEKAASDPPGHPESDIIE